VPTLLKKTSGDPSQQGKRPKPPGQ
jgi:hypothetical protein